MRVLLGCRNIGVWEGVDSLIGWKFHFWWSSMKLKVHSKPGQQAFLSLQIERPKWKYYQRKDDLM